MASFMLTAVPSAVIYLAQADLRRLLPPMGNDLPDNRSAMDGLDSYNVSLLSTSGWW